MLAYNFMFSEWEVQRLILLLEAARDKKIIIPKEAQQMLDYIKNEVEVQDRALRFAKEGKDIFASMKIDVNLINQN
jgi:hypothetical protein